MGLSNPGASSPIKRTIYVGSSGNAENVTENATSVTIEEDVPLPPSRTVILENGKKVVKVDNIKSFMSESFMSGGSIRAIKKSKGKNCKKVVKVDNNTSFMSGGPIRVIKKSKGKNCKKVDKLSII